jgi:hypothetical protein
LVLAAALPLAAPAQKAALALILSFLLLNLCWWWGWWKSDLSGVPVLMVVLVEGGAPHQASLLQVVRGIPPALLHHKEIMVERRGGKRYITKLVAVVEEQVKPTPEQVAATGWKWR